MSQHFANTVKEWNEIAGLHIDSYSKLHPRYGVEVKEILAKYKIKPRKILEVAAFSAKDSRHLASEFPNCQFYTIDLSQKAANWAQRTNVELGFKNIHAVQANAFTLPFKDKSFDISFNADFYIYFQDEDVLKLFKEQKRVTRFILATFVQNKYNVYRLLRRYLTNLMKDP